MSHVLGHEGEGSLLSKLVKEDLATSLSSYYDTELHDFSYFIITIDLTEKGFRQYEDVITQTFAYLKMMQAEGPSVNAFDEIKKSGELKWQFIEKGGIFNTVSSYSARMQLFDDSNIDRIMSSRYLTPEFNQDEIAKIINSINIDKRRKNCTYIL